MPSSNYFNQNKKYDSCSERKIVKFEPDSLVSLEFSHYLITKFNLEYDGLKSSDIQKAQFIKTAVIKEFGLANIYKISLSNRSQEVFSKANYLVVNVSRKQAALFILDSLTLVQSSLNDKSIFISGIQIVKSKGFYLVYDQARENSFKEILNLSIYVQMVFQYLIIVLIVSAMNRFFCNEKCRC